MSSLRKLGLIISSNKSKGVQVQTLLTKKIQDSKFAPLFLKRLAGSIIDSPKVQLDPVENNSALTSNYSIIVSTFESRYRKYAIPLLNQLRSCTDAEIILIVNGNFQRGRNKRPTKWLLKKLRRIENISPVFLPDFAGCARMWNLGLLISNTEINFIFNDDVIVNSKVLRREFSILSQKAEKLGLTTINNSWSHFAISRECIDSVGWFDERLLGIGEEDGDYSWRYEKYFDRSVTAQQTLGVHNLIAESKDMSISTGQGKYSLFNRSLISLKYVESDNGITAMFGRKMQNTFEELSPQRAFKWRAKNRNLLNEKNAEKVVQQIQQQV